VLGSTLALPLAVIPYATGKRILLVDDERALLAPMTRYFTRLGCTVETALARPEAEALLEAQLFDLVVLDLMLGGEPDGFALVRQVRSGPNRDRPVIVLSGLVSPETAAEAERLGADVVLSKPQPLSALGRVAMSLMGIDETQGDAPGRPGALEQNP